MHEDASCVMGRCPICLYIIREMRVEVKTLNVKEMLRADCLVQTVKLEDKVNNAAKDCCTYPKAKNPPSGSYTGSKGVFQRVYDSSFNVFQDDHVVLLTRLLG